MKVLAFLLALLPALAVAQGVQYEPRIGGGTGNVFSPYPGRVSPVVSLIAMDKGGSDSWGAGIPTPTVDCAAVGTSSVAALQCSGANPSFAGPGQVAAGSPWWYRGDAAVRPSILLNGSTDWYDVGDFAPPPTQVVDVVEFCPSSVSGLSWLLAKDDEASAREEIPFYINSGTLRSAVFRDASTATDAAVGSVAAGSCYIAARAYIYVADGTSIWRGNLNGVASTEVTTARGPIVNTTTPLRLGQNAKSGGGVAFAGKIRRWARWTGSDAPTSAAQLAQLVATQWGLAHDKPAGTVATHARTDSTPCGPFSDSELYWLGPGAPCIHAPTYQGWASGGAVAGGVEVYGPGANASLHSQALATGYNLNSGAASSDVSAFADGSVTMDRFTANRVNGPAYQLVAVTSSVGPFTFSAWARSPSGASNTSVSVACAAGNRATCSCGSSAGVCTVENTGATDCSAYAPTIDSAPTRLWVTLTCSTATTGVYAGLQGGKMASEGGVAADFGGMQVTPTAYPVPYRATTGTAYAGSASTATTVSVPVALTDPARWAIGLTFLSALATPTAYGRPLAAGTPYGPNSTTLEFHTGGGLYFDVNDAAGTDSLLLAPTMWTTAGPHTVLLSKDGTQRLAFDGAWQTLTGTPGPAAWGAVPSIITLNQAASLYPVPGLYQRLAQCRRAGGCR